ncbi:MAG: ABC transporter ATP-binding protein [Bacteroidia bacterium]|nr:ABC transporter ATP-binding protein [Bacteroidia bacterium]
MIKVENLSKSYILKHQGVENYVALRDVIVDKAKALFTSPSSIINKQTKEEFWALKDVSFDIQQGDRVGIIGRNGAGKSTLLKILSRIVTPTKGRITIDGRVASLLEVGTGFHPELSGRENIFLNGSILGMTKLEIKQKFDEIVAFAEVERFLDTPVKRYSSGMYVRLAFAVAAHLEPEILIVDEVLAVGDAAFQKKCLGKMKDVSGEGRTVIFVSHNMGQISALCSKSIILNKGQIEFDGKVDAALKIYHNMQSAASNEKYVVEKSDKDIYINEISIHNAQHENAQVFSHDEPIFVHLKYTAKTILEDLLLSIAVLDKNDKKIFTTEHPFSDTLNLNKIAGEAIVKIPSRFLLPGDYKMNVAIHIPNVQLFDLIENTTSFSIVDNGSEFSKYMGVDVGYVFSKCEWDIK